MDFQKRKNKMFNKWAKERELIKPKKKWPVVKVSKHYYDVYQYSVNHTRPPKIVAMRFEDKLSATHFMKTRCKTKLIQKNGKEELLDYVVIKNGELINVYSNGGVKTTVGDNYDVILKRFLEANDSPTLEILKNDTHIDWKG